MQNRLGGGPAAVLVVAMGLVAGSAAAIDVPFTEDFDSNPSNWRDGSGADTLVWSAMGGPDGGAFVSTSYLVPDPIPPFGAIVFRGQDEFDSSNDAFVGDWIAGGVSEFSFFVRHDAASPVDVFARFAAPGNFPGFAGISFFQVPPNVWTEITIEISAGSPQLIGEGGSFESVFGNVANVQIGLNPGVDLIGQTITLDLDKVSITPAPGALALLAVAGFAGRRRRRR